MFGQMYGGSIRNLVVEGSVTGGANSVAGIVAHGNSGTRCVNLWNKADVTGAWWIGGIAGSGVYCTGCVNSGAITCSQTSASNTQVCVGGICGTNGYQFENCYNLGTVSVPFISGATQVGGICGCLLNTRASGCYSATEVSGTFGSSCGQLFGRLGTTTSPLYVDLYYPAGSAELETQLGDAVSAVEMKQAAFAEKLGLGYLPVEGDYPQLAWQQNQ